jgi:hypothetical protein
LKDYFHIVKLIRFIPGKYNKILLIDSDVLLIFEHLDFDMNLLNKFHKLFGVSYYFENKKKDDLLCVKPCLDLSQINNHNIMYLTFNGIDNIKFPENLPNIQCLNITKSAISYLPYYPKIHAIYLSKTNILIIPDEYKNVYVMSDRIVIHNKTVKCDYWMSCSTSRRRLYTTSCNMSYAIPHMIYTCALLLFFADFLGCYKTIHNWHVAIHED